ncbi:CDP-glycerol glycerophosphotransferase family protein [Shewanella pneumatophori]|uniref:CDP-glycerol glycerophosphotransferase family protein n=1 Tax=Shewanella pneumatophori TaxID=314092 RepID=A0A9X2CID9_9GAMM|nr:CDP-glycerol glycerophosphotransferase family protein [Shewanella pneumatophori]MCL1139550.1 CDP-glycerol glycerophosphotransferase family protein [Shewanella pneumatophori]
MALTLRHKLKVTDYLKACVRKLIYTLVAVFPRSNHKAVFGSYKDSFSDNSKYLYLHWQHTQFIRTIWISGNKDVVRQRKKSGQEAYYRWSLKGIFHCLSAKYYFYNSYIGDINQWLANGATKVNLWHGLPMKKIEFDINNGPMTEVFNPQGKLNQLKQWLVSHQQLIKPDLMLSPSPLMDDIFSSAFRLNSINNVSVTGFSSQNSAHSIKEASNKNQGSVLVRSGSPRTDYYHQHPEQKIDLRYLINDSVTGINSGLATQPQYILYAPSWRDNKQQKNPYLHAFDWQQLSDHLVQNNQILLLRLHPNELALAADFVDFPNIVNLSHLEDVYGILGQIHLLITDYSSLFIDVLPLGTAVCFYRFDEQDYLQDCRNMYDYTNKLPSFAPICKSFNHLLECLQPQAISSQTELYTQTYHEVSQLFWGKGMINRVSAFSALEAALKQQR